MAAYNIVRPKYSGDRRLRAAVAVNSGKPVSSFTGDCKAKSGFAEFCVPLLFK